MEQDMDDDLAEILSLNDIPLKMINSKKEKYVSKIDKNAGRYKEIMNENLMLK